MAETLTEAEQKELEDLRRVAFEDEGAADTLLVEHKGKKYEVRAASLAIQRAAKRAATKTRKTSEGPVEEVDDFELVTLMLISCVYLPGTEVRVFQKADLDGLLRRRAGKEALITKLSNALKKLNLEDKDVAKELEEQEKNSDGIL